MKAYFVGSVLILAVLLYIPVSKIVWVLSVRRLERKVDRPLTESEMRNQLIRARVVGAILVLIFAYLFNLQLGHQLGYGN
jgi:dolichol kinase